SRQLTGWARLPPLCDLGPCDPGPRALCAQGLARNVEAGAPTPDEEANDGTNPRSPSAPGCTTISQSRATSAAVCTGRQGDPDQYPRPKSERGKSPGP